MTPAPITPAASSSAAPSNPKIENIPGHADLLKRQEELERKEAELERRERQMNQSSGANVQPNNWPPLPSWFPKKRPLLVLFVDGLCCGTFLQCSRKYDILDH